MNMIVREIYKFASFVLDAEDRILTQDGKRVRVSPKAIDLLITLIRSEGRLVDKDHLLTTVWPEVVVEEGILAVHVSQLRKALGGARHLIETVPGSGYRWVRESSAAIVHSAELHELIGTGRVHLLAASPEDAQRAVAAFQKAVLLDPFYAPAQGGLALAWCAEAQFRFREPYPKAKAAALAALTLDQFCADAWVALGSVLFFSEWNWAEAEAALKRALELVPNHSEGCLTYGQLAEALGRLEEGLRLKQRVLESYPSSPLVHLQMALSYWHLRRYEDSLQWAEKALQADRRNLLARKLILGNYKMRGDFDRFMWTLLSGYQDRGVSEEVIGALSQLYAEGGRIAITQNLIGQLAAADQPGSAFTLAIFHGELGNLDASFDYLSRALDSRDPWLVHLAVAPQWDPLRPDRRFSACLARMGLEKTASVMELQRSAGR